MNRRQPMPPLPPGAAELLAKEFRCGLIPVMIVPPTEDGTPDVENARRGYRLRVDLVGIPDPQMRAQHQVPAVEAANQWRGLINGVLERLQAVSVLKPWSSQTERQRVVMQEFVAARSG